MTYSNGTERPRRSPHITHHRSASAHRIVRAVLPTIDECARLGVRATSPLLELEQVAYLDGGRPFEYSVSRHPNGYQFRSIATR
nr:UTRA domain-containing protein [uncultured Parolsenella sp.]